MTKHATTILIADDHSIVRRGFKNLMAAHLPDARVEEVPDLSGLKARMAMAPVPDLLVLDLQFPDGNGMDLLPKLCGDPRQPPVLVYSMNPVRLHGVKAMSLGAMGYVSKDAPEEMVIEAVRTVLRGDHYHNPEMPQRPQRSGLAVKGALAPMERLSARELMVLDLLLTGAGVKDVAENLGLGISTIGTYKARIYEKLGVDNMMDLQTLVRMYRERAH